MKPRKPYPNHVEPVTPIAERRYSGQHWWDPDRLNHLLDMPEFCPSCGHSLEDGIAIEFWDAGNRVYHAWCRTCEWAGDIVRVRRMVGYEAAD